MSDLLHMFKNYSLKYDKKIKEICSPLSQQLNIPIFTYYFVEADGSFGYLTNEKNCNEYFFSEQVYLANHYFAHPAFFRSGHALVPCTLDEKTREILKTRFSADHLLLSLEVTPTKMEGFIFAEENVGAKDGKNYLSHLDLFAQFTRYFKEKPGI